MNKKETTDLLGRAARVIERLCDAHQHGRYQRAYSDLVATIERQEKEHVRFGTRLLGHRPSRAFPLRTRVHYFVQKCVLDTDFEIKNAIDAYTMRDDFRIGCAIREAIGIEAIRDALAASGIDYRTLESIDYTDLAGAA
jgi:hypothetical protein